MVALTHQNEAPLFRDICLHADDIKIRKITLNDLWQSLREGWEDYSEKPISTLTLLLLYYPLIVLVFIMFALGKDLRF